ncbi:MAG: NAD kinase [Nocardioidaceae bacterium]
MSAAAVDRRVFLVANTRREDAREVARDFCAALTRHGLAVRLFEDDVVELGLDPMAYDPPLELTASVHDAAHGCELAVVLGGDGTLLRAAELTRASCTPLLGINLGHVGFLAEVEHEDADSIIDAIVAGAYAIEERLTLDVTVVHDKTVGFRTFALNEASVEKAARQRMLEVVVGVDGRPVSRWGCDGVVCATPTGSTAYGFSAGGPIVWPGVDALLVVPISAHALFARAMVVGPDSVVAVEVLDGSEVAGVLWCDGRRTVDLPPGARVEVRRGDSPVRLVRLQEASFTDRLVKKFGLPIEGWRGAAERRLRGPGDSDA